MNGNLIFKNVLEASDSQVIGDQVSILMTNFGSSIRLPGLVQDGLVRISNQRP